MRPVLVLAAALTLLLAPEGASAQGGATPAGPGPAGARREARPRAEAVLTQLGGQVEVEEDGRWRPARPLDRVAGPERVRTGLDGSVVLTLADGSTVVLGPATTFALEPGRDEPLFGQAMLRLAGAGPVPGVPGYATEGATTIEARWTPEGAALGVVDGALRAPDGMILGAGATWAADPPSGPIRGPEVPPLPPLDAVGPPGAAAAEQGGLDVLID